MALKNSAVDGRTYDDVEPRYFNTSDPELVFDRLNSQLLRTQGITDLGGADEIGDPSQEYMDTHDWPGETADGGGGGGDGGLNDGGPVDASVASTDGLTVSFNVSGGAELTIDYGDGNSDTPTESPVEHTYAESGAYLITIDGGSKGGTGNISVVVPDSLALNDGSPMSVTPIYQDGLTAEFIITGGGDVQVTWGDGTINRPKNRDAQHVYAEAGTYTVTATDKAEGSEQEDVTVEVTVSA